MTSLSQRLRNGSPIAWRSMPEEPVEVQRAAASIARCWPHVEADTVETNPEQLVEDADRRLRENDWGDFYWTDVDRAARALIDIDLWRQARYADLLRFLLDQVRPEVNRPYLRTLFRKYIETFEPNSRLTRVLAPVLKVHWREADLPVEALVTQFRIFDLDPSPAGVIAAFMAGQDDPFAALRALGVEAPHGPGLIAAAHPLFVTSLAPRVAKGESAAARTLLSWLKPGREHEPLQGAGAAQVIDALLEPWEKRAPDADLQRLIEAHLLAAYGDPRIDSSSSGVWWPSISGVARRVILQWLAGATIEVFFDIVTRAVKGNSSGYMWPKRRKLWKELFDEDRITEAWFALSEAGVRVAEHRQRKQEIPLAFGRNCSRTSQDRSKCLLIMKVQGRWVVEGSHIFPTWIFPPGDLSVFAPYESSYTCELFRDLFHDIRCPERPEERIKHWPHDTWRNKVLTALMR
ncbi:MAG: EH signature domain-containing protein [Thiotrichales bacterium]|nr:EH signature domain-containing protein [Thiotrichales bacterium]MCY4286797.1 EH signature domain-containing protein [Thiotrichales bacterium]MCY4350724.1 EH signature domain-containing protein [Thiotrichales bacterium]